MDTVDILTYICKKRDGFVAKGMNVRSALTKAELVIAKEYHISFESINKLLQGKRSFEIPMQKFKVKSTAYTLTPQAR